MKEQKKIRDYITRNINIFDDDVEFNDDDNIFQKGFVSSLFAMKLLSFVEKEFSITVADDDINIANFSSINNIMSLVNKNGS